MKVGDLIELKCELIGVIIKISYSPMCNGNDQYRVAVFEPEDGVSEWDVRANVIKEVLSEGKRIRQI
tara:strand:+ start:210 stop:410 length:201 start_codon:yes stop_codon:yes gene_type:complete